MKFTILKLLFILCIFSERGNSQRLCSSPFISTMPYVTINNVLESTPIGGVISTLTIAGNKSQVLFSFYGGSEGLFAFDDVRKAVVLSKKLEVLGTNPLIISDVDLNCTVLATNEKTQYKLIITVPDTNDHPPVVVGLPYTITITDLTPIGSVVLVVNATDADPSDNNQLTYSIDDSPYASYFSFGSSNNPKIRLEQIAKFNTNVSFEIHILIKDNTYSMQGVQHITNATIYINVILSPDDNPAFTRSFYTAYAGVDTTIGSFLKLNPNLEVIQTDNSTLEYKILQDQFQDDWKYFELSNSKQIIVSKLLNRDVFTIVIQVSKPSNRNRYSRASVIVTSLKQQFVTKNVDILSRPNQIVYDFKLDNQMVEIVSLENKTSSKDYFTLDYASKVFKTNLFLYDITSYELNYSFIINDTLKNASYRLIVQIQIICAPRFTQKIFYFENTKKQIGQVTIFNSSNLPIEYELIQESNIYEIQSDGWITASQDSKPGINHSFLVSCHCAVGPSDIAMVTITTPTTAATTLADKQPDFRLATIILAVLASFFLLACLLLIGLLICSCNSSSKMQKKFKDKQLNYETNHNYGYDSPREYDEQSTRTINASTTRPDSIASLRVEGAVHESSSSDNYKRSRGNQKPQCKTTKPKFSVGGSKAGEKSEMAKRSSKQESNGQRQFGLLNPALLSTSNLSLVDHVGDYSSSMDTISASNTTLTRPAVGTNGITVYY